MPIVFVAVTDPVGGGLVESLARPGSNATGFTSAEFGMSAKWLELVKEIAPRVTRVAVLQEPGNPGGLPQFAAIQSVAPSFGVELSSLFLRDAGDIEQAVAAFARNSNGGLIVTRTSGAISHRELIITLAARHRLPAVYPLRLFVTGGGLISYGPDIVDQYRRAAGYVDRILKGEKPADLPVQAPTKYEWSSISRPPRRWGSTCRRRCSRAPTRCSNEAARFHHASRRRGGDWPLAARAQQASRVVRIGYLSFHVCLPTRTSQRRVSGGSSQPRLRRRQELPDRISLRGR